MRNLFLFSETSLPGHWIARQVYCCLFVVIQIHLINIFINADLLQQLILRVSLTQDAAEVEDLLLDLDEDRR